MADSPPAGGSPTPERVAVVTGAGSGIGREIALRLARDGVAVAALDVDLAAARETTALGDGAPGRLDAWEVDVRDVAGIALAIDAVEQTFGRVDVLVNSAGALHVASIVDTTPADWNRVLEVNLTGSFFCLQQAIPAMRRAGGGRVVNVASVGALIGSANRSAYAASKGAVIAMTRQTAAELAPVNIQVNAVAPGYVATPMAAGYDPTVVDAMLAACPAGRQGTPAEVAATVAFLASDESRYITGEVISVDGGLSTSLLVDAEPWRANFDPPQAR